MLIDFYLIFLILVVKINYDYFKILKKKFNNFIYTKEKFKEYYFHNSGEFAHYIVGDNLFLGYIRDSIISFKQKKNQNNKNLIIVKKKIAQKNIFLIFINKLFNFLTIYYVKFRKPIILINCYFGKKNSLTLFFASIGKIVNIPRDFFFVNNFDNNKKQPNARKKIISNFKTNDEFDKIIRNIIKETIPSSFIEDYKVIKEKNCHHFNLKKIGSAVDLYDNDEFKIVAAEILKGGGKLMAFKHGGISEREIVNPVEIINSLYSSNTYEWNNKKGLGENYLNRLKKFNINNIKHNKQILLFCSNISFNERYAPVIKYSNHPRLNIFYDFYHKINNVYKKNCEIRLFPGTNSHQIKKIWIEKFGNNFKLSQDSKEQSIHKSKIIILDDLSTPIYEFLKTEVPFIIIMKDSYHNIKPNFRKELIKLKSIGLIHNSAESGANFLNNNYENLHDWWTSIIKNKNFIKFKKILFSSNKKFLQNIRKELMYDL